MSSVAPYYVLLMEAKKDNVGGDEKDDTNCEPAD
jgi:hypothetical protein